MKFKTLILCRYLLSGEKEEACIKENQMVAVDHKGLIGLVSSVPEVLPSAGEVIHFPHHVLCPGLINTHTHLPMTLFRGLGDHLTLKQWLHDLILPLEKHTITEEFVRVGTELAALELIKNGITTVCDMYFHTPVMAEVLDSYGLRAVLAVDMLNSFSDWEKDLNTLNSRYKDHERISPALACHAPYTCSPELLKQAAEESQKNSLPVIIHVAETLSEVQFIKKQYGKTPVAHLKNCGLVGPDCLFAHCVHLNEEDIQIMAESKTPVSYNPESNMKLGSGSAPVWDLLKKGVVVSLGTDGAASNNNLNLFTEMDTAAKLQKLKYPDSVILPKDIFAMASSEGGRALRIKAGRIKPGFFADLTAVNLKYPHLYPRHNLLSHLVYSATGQEVEFVMCHGRVLMQNSQIKGVSPDKIYHKVERIKRQINAYLSQKG